jgi:hypothetical protein
MINDSRVGFFKGWFDEVLPRYSPPAHGERWRNADCASRGAFAPDG